MACCYPPSSIASFASSTLISTSFYSSSFPRPRHSLDQGAVVFQLRKLAGSGRVEKFHLTLDTLSWNYCFSLRVLLEGFLQFATPRPQNGDELGSPPNRTKVKGLARGESYVYFCTATEEETEKGVEDVEGRRVCFLFCLCSDCDGGS